MRWCPKHQLTTSACTTVLLCHAHCPSRHIGVRIGNGMRSFGGSTDMSHARNCIAHCIRASAALRYPSGVIVRFANAGPVRSGYPCIAPGAHDSHAPECRLSSIARSAHFHSNSRSRAPSHSTQVLSPLDYLSQSLWAKLSHLRSLFVP